MREFLWLCVRNLKHNITTSEEIRKMYDLLLLLLHIKTKNEAEQN